MYPEGTRFGRRAALRRAAGAAAGVTGALAGLPARAAFAAARGAAPTAPPAQAPQLMPFPADAAPFDQAGRSGLARDLLTTFVRQDGLFPGRGVYLLPAPAWFGGWAPPAARGAWDLTVDAGAPLYLLAHADPTGRLNPTQITVRVNGEAISDLDRYVHAGIAALHAGAVAEHAVLDVVFAPPFPGRYLLEVSARVPALASSPEVTLPVGLNDEAPRGPDESGRPGALGPATESGEEGGARAGRGESLATTTTTSEQGVDGDERALPEDAFAGAAPASAWVEWTLAYDITVQAARSLGPLALRDGAGRVYAQHGGARRLVPDSPTFGALGYGAGAALVLDAAPETLSAIPVGSALPSLSDGALVQSVDGGPVFRLDSGMRRLDAGRGDASAPAGAAAQRTEDAVLASIPPMPADGMLLRSTSGDLFHVDGGALRKAPDLKWASDKGLEPTSVSTVAAHLVPHLPQNSPHWVIPGGTWEDHEVRSDALDATLPYRVFLPPGYDARPDQRYPVLYLLHGMGGRYDEWSGYGLEEVANQLLADRRLDHFILVQPQGGLGYWTNQEPGAAPGERWGDYVALDLVRHIDATYRTLPQRAARAVGGLSMGAHGALQLALAYPDVFGVAGAHSPSLRTEADAPAFLGRGPAFQRHDPLSLVHASTLASPPRLWVDCGTNDPWRAAAEALHGALVDKGWAHEWRVSPGEHDGWYWGDHLWEYLPFYGGAFARNSVPLVR